MFLHLGPARLSDLGATVFIVCPFVGSVAGAQRQGTISVLPFPASFRRTVYSTDKRDG